MTGYDLGTIIRRARSQKHWSRSDLCWRARVSYAGLYEIETYHRKPRYVTARKLLGALGKPWVKYLAVCYPKPQFIEFSRRFRNWMETLHLTLPSLHRISGVKLSRLYGFYSGANQPNARTFYQIIRYLSVDPLKTYFYLYSAPHDTFGSVLRALRYTRGLLTIDEARLLGYNQQTAVSNMELSSREPTLKMVQRYARLFHIKPSSLYRLYSHNDYKYKALCRDYALDHHVTYQQIAQMCGLSASHLYRILSGRVKPTLYVQLELIMQLHISPRRVLPKRLWSYIGTNGYYLACILASHHWSARYFAKLAGISYQAVANYIHNACKPQKKTYEQIRSVLDKENS